MPYAGRSPECLADGDVTHGPVLGQRAQQHEVALGAPEWLRVERGPQQPHVEAGALLHIRHDDIQVIDTWGVDGQQLALLPAPRRQHAGGRHHEKKVASSCDFHFIR